METIYEVVRVKQEVKKTELPLIKIQSPSDAVALINDYILEEDREILLVVVLNTKNCVTAVHRCHMGTLNASLASPRDVYKTALNNNAAALILAHNHPSGEVKPSQEDIKLTNLMVEAGQLFQIEVLDHIIVGWQEGYYSFKENALI
ncbi:JAB domain-containing protein [Paenibacillus solani]|uniref:JAB domain-containing protein n=1 Tax=Paenibacillus solani TaxID=1705565 RepID=UPI003D2AB3AD